MLLCKNTEKASILRNFLHFYLIFGEHFTPKLYIIRNHMYLDLNLFYQPLVMQF